jgi:hypothetical protein
MLVRRLPLLPMKALIVERCAHVPARVLSWRPIHERGGRHEPGTAAHNPRGGENGSGVRPRCRLSLRCHVVAAWVAVCLVAWALPAVAGPRADIEKRLSAAMESYDLLEYETARKLLVSALEIAKEARLDEDPIAARLHLSMGIVYFAGLQDKAAARREFISAVTVDPLITIDPGYKTPDMSTLLETVRATTSGTGRSGPARPVLRDGEVDCLTLSGLKHALVDRAPRGAAQRLAASVGGDILAAKVSLFWRAARATEFQEIRMIRDRDCTYAAAIPANAMSGNTLYYYIAAANAAGTVVASSGSAGAPNLIELSGSAVRRDPGQDENPLRRGPGKRPANPPELDDVRSARDVRAALDESADPDAAEPEQVDPEARIERRSVAESRPRKLMVVLGAASGIGYVTGETEQLRNKVQCCVAPGLFTASAEIGYATSNQTVLSLALRLGVPVGANIDGHSTFAPAGFLRARYALAPSPSSLFVMVQLGGGILRNTIKLRDTGDGMDTDIVALGPMLAGAGMGYRAALTPGFQLMFDLSFIAGIPVVGEIGNSKLNFGIHGDASIGAALRF